MNQIKEKPTPTKGLEHMESQYPSASTQSKVDLTESITSTNDSSITDEISKFIPNDSFFHMISMPKNWEQVQRLKNRKHALHKNLFCHKMTENRMSSDVEVSKDSEEEIDVENISVHDMATDCGINSSHDNSGAESDDSMVCLQIVEVEDLKNDHEESTVVPMQNNPNNPKSSQKILETVKSCKTANDTQRQEFDDRASDLCSLSAVDINNSLFDTIATLKQSMEPVNTTKPSSLENIISRIKSDTESTDKSTVYHVVNPVAGKMHSDVGVCGSEASIPSNCKNRSLSVNASKESVHLVPKKKRKQSEKKKNSQTSENGPEKLKQFSGTDTKTKSSFSTTDMPITDSQYSCKNERFPVKLKLKKWLKMQNNSAKIQDEQHNSIKSESSKIKNAENMGKCGDATTCKSKPSSIEKNRNENHEKELCKISRKVTGKSVEHSQSTDDLSLYKLKYECIQNQMKLLKYESKLLGLKEKLLEKKSMQHYLKTLTDKCKSGNLTEKITGFRVMNRGDYSECNEKLPQTESEKKCTEDRSKSPFTGHELETVVSCKNVSNKLQLTDLSGDNGGKAPDAKDHHIKCKTDQNCGSMCNKEKENTKTETISHSSLKDVASEKTQPENIQLSRPSLASSAIKTKVSGSIDRYYTNLTVATVTSHGMHPCTTSVNPTVYTSSNSAPINIQNCLRGYHIQRPQCTISSPWRSTVRYTSNSLTTDTSTVTIQGGAPSSQSVQIVQGQTDGRLYAVVNNVLQPIVHNVNGQYLPVLNSTQPSRTSQNGQMESMSSNVLNPALLPVTPYSVADPISKTSYTISSSSSFGIPVYQQSLLSSSQLKCAGHCTVSSTKPVVISEASKGSMNLAQRLKGGMTFLDQTSGNSMTGGYTGVNTLPVVTESQSAHTSRMTRERYPDFTTNRSTVSDNTKPTTCGESKEMKDTDLGRITSQQPAALNQQIPENMHTGTVKPLHQNSITQLKTTEASLIKQFCNTNFDKGSHGEDSAQVAKFANNPIVVPMYASDSTNILPVPPNCHDTSNKLAHENTIKRIKVIKKSTNGNDNHVGLNLKQNSHSLPNVEHDTKTDQQDSNNNQIITETDSCQSVEADHSNKELSKANHGSSIHFPFPDSEDSFDSMDWDRYENTCQDLKVVRDESAMKTKSKSKIWCEENSGNSKSEVIVAKTETSVEKDQTPVPSGVKTASLECTSKASSRGPQKRYVKTKFIILKGDICDRWLAIKNKTGYEGMSDPSFVQYLLKMEEMRQTQLARMQKYYRKKKLAKASEDSCCHVTHSMSNSQQQKEEGDDMIERKRLPPEPIISLVKQNGDILQSCANTVIKDGNSEIGTKTVCNQDVATKRILAKRKKDLCDVSLESVNIKRGRYEFLSENTKRQMSWAVSVFTEWLKESGEDCPLISSKDACWLNEKLRLFYVKARTLSGLPYPSTILQNLRRALSLWLSMSSSNASISIGISIDAAYESSNRLLSTIMHARTDENISSIQPVSRTDLEKLYSGQTFSEENPENLLWKVWFDTVRHLCTPMMPKHFMGCLNKQNLSLESDVCGVYYCFEDLGYVPDCEQPGKMYATPSEPETCPVRTTSLYLSRLNEKCSYLFQYPNRDWSCSSQERYMPFPVDNELLISLMEKISSHAGLSTVYTIANVIATKKNTQL